MKLKTSLAALAAVSLLSFTACDDTTSTIGASLTGDNVAILIDSTYTLTGRTVETGPISPKTSQMLIGAINVPEYGTMRSNVVTQFLPVTAIDTTTFTVEQMDSVFLTLQYSRGAFIGDSVAPLGITVYELNRQLPQDINSAFNPADFYNSTPLGSVAYNTAIFEDDSLSYHSTRSVNVPLPLEFGKKLYNAYVENSANFANGQVFSENVLPGMYIENSYGSGRMTLFSRTGICMHFFKEYYDEDEKCDTTYATTYNYMLVTPEVLSNNDLDINLSDGLKQRYADGKTLLVAPAGYEAEVEFPLTEIINTFRTGDKSLTVANSLTLSIPVDTIANYFGVSAPPYALMVLKKDRESFFANNKVPDDVTSFYATYNSTTGSYDFSSMLNYLTEMLKRDDITAEDWTFSVVPVQINFEETVSSSYYYYGTSSSVISEVQPYLISPAMCELRLPDAKIKFTYSRQIIK